MGRCKSSRRKKRERAAVFTEPRKPSPGRGRRIARVGAALALLLAVGSSIPKAYSGLQGSDLFKLQEIIVAGNHFLTVEDVVCQSGLSQGTSLFDTNLKSATDSIVSHPLVRNALLLRRPPDSLVISIEERVPLALVSTNEGLVGFDRDAVTFWLPNVPFDLPIVTGLDKVLSDSKLSEFAVRHNVARFIETALREQPDFWHEVSEVCLLTPEEGDLILADRTMLKVRLDGIGAQMQNYRAFRAAGDVLLQDLAYIDLRYENQVIAGRQPTELDRLGQASAARILD